MEAPSKIYHHYVSQFLSIFLHRCAFSFEEECKLINDKGSKITIDNFLEGFFVCEG